MKNKEASFGSRLFVPFDVDTSLGFIVCIDDKGKKRRVDLKVMVHPCSDDPNGVIFWFRADEL